MSGLKQRSDAKIDPISVEGLRAWLMMQPKNRAYYWPDPDRCVVALYLRETLYSYMSENVWRLNATKIYEDAVYAMKIKCPEFCIFAVGAGASDYSQWLLNRDGEYRKEMSRKWWTCGAALKRLNEIVK